MTQRRDWLLWALFASAALSFLTAVSVLWPEHGVRVTVGPVEPTPSAAPVATVDDAGCSIRCGCPPRPPAEWADGGYACMLRMVEAGTWEGDFAPCHPTP